VKVLFSRIGSVSGIFTADTIIRNPIRVALWLQPV